jgi:hypothetical protein
MFYLRFQRGFLLSIPIKLSPYSTALENPKKRDNLRMEMDCVNLIPAIIDARRNGHTDELTRLLLRFLTLPNEQMVFLPEEPIRFLQAFVDIKKTRSYETFQSLGERNIISESDKNVLHLNRQFSTKGPTPSRFPGKSLFLSPDESAYMQGLFDYRQRIIDRRGKNKKSISKKKQKEEDDMTAVVQALVKQLDVKDSQIGSLLQIVLKIANGEKVSQADAKEMVGKLVDINTGKEYATQ